MGVALENARLFDETQRLLKETEQRNAELAVINSIQQGIARSLSFQAIVELVGDKLREVLAHRHHRHPLVRPRDAHGALSLRGRARQARDDGAGDRFGGALAARSPRTAASSSATRRPKSRRRASRPGTECSLSTVTAKIVAGDRVRRRRRRRELRARARLRPERDPAAADDRRRDGRRARERAPVRRDAAAAAREGAARARSGRVARLPDRHQRRAARHQPVADRRHAGVRGHPGLRDAPLRQRRRGDLSLRRPPREPRRDAATGRPRHWRWRTRSIRRRRTRRSSPGARSCWPACSRSTTRSPTLLQPRIRRRRLVAARDGRADAEGRRAGRRDPGRLARPRPNAGAPDRADQDLRRPGRDRDRERSPAQRDQGSARAADRDGGGPARHQRLGDRDASRSST